MAKSNNNLFPLILSLCVHHSLEELELLLQVKFKYIFLLCPFFPLPLPNTLHNEFPPSSKLYIISNHIEMKSRAEERTQKRSKAFIKEGKGLEKEIVCTLSVPAVSQLGSRGRTMYNLFQKLNYLPSSHTTVFHRHSSDCVNTL